MKNTYKESWDYIKLLVEDVIGDYSADGIEDDPICELDELVAQNTPPTWEEVVNAWGKLGYNNVNLSEQYGMVLLVGCEKNTLYVSLEDGIESNNDVYVDISVDMINATNLTLRYLESQQ